MYKIGEEEMVICPYNRYHVVSRLRIQKHIVKCKKNYPDVKLATCFYNYCHRLNPESMLAHYGVCSHKTRVEGSRYEFDYYNSTSSAKAIQQSKKFPDINVKPQFFCNHFPSSSCSSHSSCGNMDKLDSSDSDPESGRSTFKVEFSDDNSSSDDDLEPLPLPKTVSKAFTCAKEKPDTLKSATSAKISQSKGYGRAKNFLACLPSTPSRTTEHLLPDLRSFDCSTSKKGINSGDFSNNIPSSSSASITSSMFDDTSTFKSEEVVFDKDESDGDNASLLIFKGIDKYIEL